MSVLRPLRGGQEVGGRVVGSRRFSWSSWNFFSAGGFVWVSLGSPGRSLASPRYTVSGLARPAQSRHLFPKLEPSQRNVRFCWKELILAPVVRRESIQVSVIVSRDSV